jgi:hypothetical protein
MTFASSRPLFPAIARVSSSDAESGYRSASPAEIAGSIPGGIPSGLVLTLKSSTSAGSTPSRSNSA